MILSLHYGFNVNTASRKPSDLVSRLLQIWICTVKFMSQVNLSMEKLHPLIVPLVTYFLLSKLFNSSLNTQENGRKQLFKPFLWRSTQNSSLSCFAMPISNEYYLFRFYHLGIPIDIADRAEIVYTLIWWWDYRSTGSIFRHLQRKKCERELRGRKIGMEHRAVVIYLDVQKISIPFRTQLENTEESQFFGQAL
jgi:hypothetical protein